MRAVGQVFARFFALVLFGAVLAALVAASGCKREKRAQRTVAESTVATLEEQTLAEEQARQLRPSPPTNERPVDLLRFVSQSATAVAWVDVDAFRGTWAEGLVGDVDARREAMVRAGRQLDLLGNDPRIIAKFGEPFRFSETHELVAATGSSDDDWLVVVNGEVSTVRGGPRPINPRSQVMIGERDGYVFFGQGAMFDRAMQGLDEAQRYVPEAEWSDGWHSMHERQALLFFSSRFDEIPEQPFFTMPQLGESAPSHVAISGSVDGSVHLAVRNADRKPMLQLLGAAYEYSMNASTLENPELPRFLRDWGAYTELVNRGIWSRVRVESNDQLTRLTLVEPACGRPLRNLVPVMGIAGSIQRVLAENSLEGARLFETVEAPIIAGCAVIEGPASRLPVAGLRATIDGQKFSALGLLDYGALLRENLPTAFQILPFSLDPDAIVKVFEGEPVGLTAQESEGARLVAYVEKTYASEPAEWFFGLPREAAPLLPSRVAGTLQKDEDLGHIAGTPPLLGRYLTAGQRTNAWTRAAVEFPDDAAAAVMAPALVFDAFATQLELPAVVAGWLRSVTMGTLLIEQELPMSFYFDVEGDAATIATDVERYFRESLSDLLMRSKPAKRAHRGGLFFQSLATLLSSELTVDALDDDTVRIGFGAYGRFATGVLSAVSLYSAMVRLQVVEDGWPKPRIELTPQGIQPHR